VATPPGRPPHAGAPPHGGAPPSRGRLSRRVRGVLLVAAGLLVLVAAGVFTAVVFIRDDEVREVPPARHVAGAYWTAVQRKDLAAMRRVLCDDDRVLLAAVDDQTLSRLMFPAGRRVLGYSITGQQDQPVVVVLVQVIREDGGRVYTVTRPTPVIQQAGMFMVCFHSAGLRPGT
jgi:hypothetical protein